MTNDTMRLVMTTAAAFSLAVVICAIGWRPTPPELERDDDPPPAAPIPTNRDQREELEIKLLEAFFNATHTNWVATIRRRENQQRCDPENAIRKRLERMLNETFTNWDISISWKEADKKIPISNTNTNKTQ